MDGKDKVSALHLAAQAGNAKLCGYLIDNGALGSELGNNQEKFTPLMFAAKLGYINVMAMLLKKLPINAMKVRDLQGRTALHMAGLYGQTRACLFLLRCGLDKKLVDVNGKSAGALAEEVGFIVTGQAIMTYAENSLGESLRVLNFIIEKELKKSEPKPMLDSLASDGMKNLSESMAAMSASLNNLGDSIWQSSLYVVNRIFGTKYGVKEAPVAFEA